jgi:Cu(I)/Ag(I) efflux system membrane protein CusA/SilA
MIGRIIRWSATNAALIGLASLLLAAGGVYALGHIPLDALPDLSDTQVIIYTEYPGQAPQVVEDQVTYPLTSSLLSVPRSKAVRGLSYFGTSFVYVIFEDGTDVYWARSRVLEYLNSAAQRLPSGVSPSLGPDATGVGWVYQYAVIGTQRTLAELRTLQDWYLRYAIAKAPGVAEVAGVGGFVQQYQIVVDPRRLQAYGIGLKVIEDAVRSSNSEIGARVIEMADTEYVIRGRGYIKSLEDLEHIVLRSKDGTPLTVGDVARVQLGPDERRGISELNGEGEAVGGIAVQRYAADAPSVIANVKARISEMLPSLPKGVQIIPVYDRSDLIQRAVATLRRVLLEESAIVALVSMVFLFHFRSALVAIVMLPVGVLIAFLAMHLLGLSSNIMSLGGIAIAIGAMVDAAIVMIENAHKHLERAVPGKPRAAAIIEAVVEVGPSLFFSLLVITVSFLPIFALEDQEGRLFKPLAFTKTFAMAAGALLSVTLVPMLMMTFIRGHIRPEEANPLNRLLLAIYRPVINWALRSRLLVVGLAITVLAMTAFPAARLGSEFMPTLNEGTLFYMPVGLPGLSITKAAELLQTEDKIIKSFPEVASVFGKAGRAATATDPAPTEMTETIINLKPEAQWRSGMTMDKLIAELDQALQFPGITNAWTQPIKARTDMLATGIRTPVGVKVYGPSLDAIASTAEEIERVLRTVPGTTSAYAERVKGGYYIVIDPNRVTLARYGLTVRDVQDVVGTALGGEAITTVVDGRERYTVNLRYARDFRSDPLTIAKEVRVSSPMGATIPLAEVADVRVEQGPATIRTENAQLAAYILVDTRDGDLGGYVARAAKAVADNVKLTGGVYIQWSGQFEYLQRAKQRLLIVVPVTLVLIFLLLYMNFGRIAETVIVMLSVPFSVVGGVWLMYFLGYNLSIAVAVGFIALAGVAAETGVVMLLYLDRAWSETRLHKGPTASATDLHSAIIAGAVDRVRPKMMTVVAIIAGLLPILWSTGAGAEVMRRIAVPMVGGMLSSALLTLVVIPVIYSFVKSREVSPANDPGAEASSGENAVFTPGEGERS